MFAELAGMPSTDLGTRWCSGRTTFTQCDSW